MVDMSKIKKILKNIQGISMHDLTKTEQQLFALGKEMGLLELNEYEEVTTISRKFTSERELIQSFAKNTGLVLKSIANRNRSYQVYTQNGYFLFELDTNGSDGWEFGSVSMPNLKEMTEIARAY